MPIRVEDPVSVPRAEREQVRKLERMLDAGARVLVSPAGERVELPESVLGMLCRMVELMAAGQAVALVPHDRTLTTQQAADLLGMSRPSFVKLLETGAITYHRVGNQRRVLLGDLVAFAGKWDQERREAVDTLAREAFEAGLYDRNVFPEGGRDQ